MARLTIGKLVEQLGDAARENEALRRERIRVVGRIEVLEAEVAQLQVIKAENAALKLEVERVTLGAVLMSHRWNRLSAAVAFFQREFGEAAAMVQGNERTRQMEKRHRLAAVIEDMKATDGVEDTE